MIFPDEITPPPRFAPLTPEQQALAAKWRRLVHKLAKGFGGYGLPHDDLVGAGYVGLCIGASRFDPSRGVKFSTYSGWWIRHQIVDFIISNWSQMSGRRSSKTSRLFFQIRREIHAEHGSDAIQVVAERHKLDPEILSRFVSRGVPLDAGIQGFELVSERTPEQDAIAAERQRQTARVVGEAMATLTPVQREVVRRRLLVQDEPETFREIGQTLLVTRQRVQQIEEKAICVLRTRLAGAA